MGTPFYRLRKAKKVVLLMGKVKNLGQYIYEIQKDLFDATVYIDWPVTTTWLGPAVDQLATNPFSEQLIAFGAETRSAQAGFY